MSATPRILAVDDEAAIRRFLRSALISQGYEVVEAETGQAAVAATASAKPDLVVLDLGLPDIDGLEVLRRIRQTSPVPVIVLSVRSDEKGKVEALDLGADDYVTKPFGMEELTARVRTALRHRLQEQGATPIFHAGDLAVDLVRRVVTVSGNEVKLSAKEYELLRLLVMHAGKVLTHQFLLRELWGRNTLDDVQYLRVYVRALRQKLGEDPARPRFILTETGVGYRLKAPE